MPVVASSQHPNQQLSLVKRLNKFSMVSPLQTIPTPLRSNRPERPTMLSFGLTPVIEDLNDLALTSNRKKPRDDFDLQESKPKTLVFSDGSNAQEREQPYQEGAPHEFSDEDIARQLTILFDEEQIPERHNLEGKSRYLLYPLQT